MQHTPPPPPPGHWGTYRVPTGILTAAAHRHPANPSFAAFQPQRGVSPYTRPSAPYQPQPTFPPQPPQIQSTVPSHSSPPRPPPTRSFQTPPLPSDFVPSEQYHDCKVVYGYDLPKAVRTTTYTQKIGIAGCPIETVPLLAIVRHSWSSYWLRYLCHGHEIFPVFTKHISQAMLATELFSRLNHNKIDLDTVALAHCQGAIPPIPNPTKKQALGSTGRRILRIHERPHSRAVLPTHCSYRSAVQSKDFTARAAAARCRTGTTCCSQQQSRYTCHSY